MKKTISMALQIEAGLRNAGVLSGSTATTNATASGTTTAASVRAINRQPKRNRYKHKKNSASHTAPAAQTKAEGRSCYRCGSTNHLANKPSCPAAKSTCNSCGKMGHFSKVCRSAQKDVCEIVINELTVLYMTDTVRDEICTVHIDADGHSHEVELIVDTGSSVSIIPESIYHTNFPTCKLSEPTVNLFTLFKREYLLKGACRPQLVMMDIQLQAHL